MMDSATSQRALVHIKSLLKAVECHVCSSTLMTPLVGRCGHGACARCWARSPLCCPLCALTAARQEVRPHLALATRAAAVLRLADAFQKYTGVEVAVSSPSSGTINFIKDEDSEDWFYLKDKKLPKKTYEKKRESTISNLQSASQVEATIVFPGEAIDTSVCSNDKSGKPDPLDKVKGWLECTLNVFSEEDLPTATQGKLPPQPVKVIPNASYEKFFTDQHAEHLPKSQPDWDEIQVISSEPIYGVEDNITEPIHGVEDNITEPIHVVGDNITEPIHGVGDNIARAEDNSSVSIEECNSSKEHPIKNDSLLEKFFTNAMNKTGHNTEEQEHSIKNVIKDKNPWKNVKKMKKDLKKHSRPLFKKLDTSIDIIPIVPAKCSQLDTCGDSPVIEVTKSQMKDGVADPIQSPEFVVQCAASAESSIPSPICLDSPQDLLPRVDKDYLACQQALIKSAMYKDMQPADLSSSKSEADSSKNLSEIPLTHFSPNTKNDVSKVKRIVEKIEKKIIVSDILKDFTDDDMSECSSTKPPIKSIKNDSFSKSVEIVRDSEAQRETSYDFNSVVQDLDDGVIPNIGEETRGKPIIDSDIEILHSDYKETTAAPFVYRGRSNSQAQNRKVPFYYKSKCNPNISCIEQQDGLNIEITRDNIVTTIVIRNHPVVHLSGDSRCHVKVAKTRDAQTSPIPFAQLDGNPLPREESDDELFAEDNEIDNQNKISFDMVKSVNIDPQSDKLAPDSRSIKTNLIDGAGDRHVQKPKVDICTDVYEMTASLENEMRENYSLECDPKFPVRVASKVIPSTCSKITSQKCSIRPVNNSTKEAVKPQSDQLVCSYIDSSQNSSLPLQVTIPDVHNSASLSFKKRKHLLDEDDKITVDSDPKKVRTKDDDGIMDEDLIINYVDDSQTQESVKEQPAAVACPDSEPMNYDEIMGTVFANIDKDLQLAKGSQKSGMKPIKKCNQTLDKSNTIKLPLSIIHKPELTREECDNFSQIQKDDVTDLRNLSMDIETDVKYSENMFNTIYEKNSLGFRSQTSQIVNVLPKNSSQIINKEVGESSGSRPAVVSKGLQERTIELSPEEQMLLTPTNKLGESMLMQPGEDVFTPQIDKLDFDDVVEDTPQKPRKITILKKGQDKTNKLSSSLRRVSQSENANVSDVVPLELTQIEKSLSSENLLTKNTAEKVNFALLKKIETPLSITKFNNDVKSRSTPNQAPARRSLNYMDALSKITEDDEKSQINMDDNEIQSISERYIISRQNTAHSNTCNEKEFLEQAFEISANDSNKKNSSGRESAIIGFTSKDNMVRAHGSQVKLLSKQVNKPETSPRTKSPSVCIATSCLVKDQVKAVKELVANMGWKFSDQYSEKLTHLVVKVDENNISQRTVKYMQALADGKWIVSYNWIAQCANKNRHVKEEDYEVLDTSGGMGPQISRTSNTKLFKGITFYLVAPLTTLKEDDLLGILKATGGTVADNIKQIEVQDLKKVVILLADPASTQDDRFFDVCSKHPVVPLNVEWVLDSLGQGRLEGAASYLLVPRSLLPTVDWPFSLASDESMDEANS